VIRMRHVFKSYGSGRLALRDVTFRMGRADFVVLAGPTGSGKTTLLRLVLMEEMPTKGEVLVKGASADHATPGQVAQLRREMGIIPQEPVLLQDRDVYENVALAYRMQVRGGHQLARTVMQVLAQVGIAHKRGARPSELSGGEQQLVAVARAIVCDPWLIVADEPLAGLDRGRALGVVRLLRSLNIRGSALLVAAHQEDPWRGSGARVIRMEQGELKGATEVGARLG
jgi:cell division transport system ATP-binding protein